MTWGRVLSAVFLIYGITTIPRVHAQGDDAVSIEASPGPATTLIGLLGTPDFRLLNKLVTITNLTGVLSGTSDRTLFAPNNEAFKTAARSFGSLAVGEDDSFDAVLNVLNVASEGKITEIARKVILYHIIASKDSSLINTTKTLDTQAGELLIATGEGELESYATVNAKIVSEAPSDVDNWLVYEVDNILLPFLVTASTKATAAATTAPVIGAGVGAAAGAAAATAAGTGAETSTGGADDAASAPKGGYGNAVAVNNTGGDSVCFPADAQVELSDGRTVNIEEIVPGDLILVGVKNGSNDSQFSPVYGFTHRKSDGLYDFYRISTRNKFTITLSGAHYVYANDVAAPARNVCVGDILATKYGKSPVVTAERVVRRGLFAPHTIHGDIVVNDVVASCYTELLPRDSAHAALAPVRTLVKIGISTEPLGNIFYDGWPTPSFGIPTAISTFLWARALYLIRKDEIASYFSKELSYPELN